MWQTIFLGLIAILLLYIALKKDSSSPCNTDHPYRIIKEEVVTNNNCPKNNSSLSIQPSYQYPPQYPSPRYYPQSLGMPRNVYLDYVNDLYQGYYPGYNYTWDSKWNRRVKKEEEKQYINIENKPQFSINQTFQTPTQPTSQDSFPTFAPLPSISP
jgi:hypothetical protein